MDGHERNTKLVPARDKFLITPEQLSKRLTDPTLKVLDVTAMLNKALVNKSQDSYFEKGHIPGAQFFDVSSGTGVLSNTDSALPWTWPSKAQFEQTMGEFGIANDNFVVITATTPRPGLDSGTMWCARAWWVMHHYGVQCVILEGGNEAWQRQGLPTTQEVTPVKNTQFKALEDAEAAITDSTGVLNGISADDYCLIDMLPSDSFTGKTSGYGPRKGHISSAVNKPFSDFVIEETAAFKSQSQLASYLDDVLQRPHIITYCGGAIAATVGAFTLKMFGHNSVTVYDASLMEWSQNDKLPMTDPSSD